MKPSPPAISDAGDAPFHPYTYQTEGQYLVMLVTTNEYGCSDTSYAQHEVTFEAEPPNVFTPNGDGINDTWEMDGIDLYPNPRIRVFNRWGQVVYESEGEYNLAKEFRHCAYWLQDIAIYLSSIETNFPEINTAESAIDEEQIFLSVPIKSSTTEFTNEILKDAEELNQKIILVTFNFHSTLLFVDGRIIICKLNQLIKMLK